MAVDEALLACAANAPSDPIRLRYYAWSEPTLSLGYFQQLADRKTHSASIRCPIVRRSSGGGAILHDHELTFSLAVPAAACVSADPNSLYAGVHNALVAALAEFGVEASRACEFGMAARLVCSNGELACATSADSTKSPIAKREPFLCFQRLSGKTSWRATSRVWGRGESLRQCAAASPKRRVAAW